MGTLKHSCWWEDKLIQHSGDSWAIFIKTLKILIVSWTFLGFPGDLSDKEYACNAGDLGSIPGLGRSPREGNGNPLQYLEK